MNVFINSSAYKKRFVKLIFTKYNQESNLTKNKEKTYEFSSNKNEVLVKEVDLTNVVPQNIYFNWCN